MANQFETSFVPREPLLKVEAGVQRPREPLNLSFVVSLIVFFVTLALAGGAYFYEQQVSQQVDAKGKELAAKETLFDTTQIPVYKDLQTTLTTAKGLVDAHTIFTQVFNLLELRSAENIGLTQLSFTQDGQHAILTLSGQAPSYEAVYYQAQKWRESKPIIQSVDVTALSLEETSGIVNFGVKINLDASTFTSTRVLSDSKNAAAKEAATPTVSTVAQSSDQALSTSTKPAIPANAKKNATNTPAI